MDSYLSWWDVPVEHVPEKTGAASVMDLSDIREVLDHFELDLTDKYVVDVGCGTGRLAQACGIYVGFDLSPSMVKFTKQQGLCAYNVSELATFRDSMQPDLVACLSVFTHISRADRQAYLARFRELAPELLVDILPGVEGGSPAIWYADPDLFQNDLRAAGFHVVSEYSRTSPDGAYHRYYHCRL